MIYFVIIASLLSSPIEFTVIVNGQNELNLAKIQSFELPKTIELSHEKRMKVTYVLSKGGRKLYSSETHTNQELKLLRLKGVDNLSITIDHPKGKIIHRIKILPH